MAESRVTPADPDEIARLEAAAAAAWPAREVHDLDGWRLYASGGGTRRTQSVQPVCDGALDLDDRIDACERFYTEQSAACVFRLTPASVPSELDRRLEERGYVESDPTSVQTAGLGIVASIDRDERVAIDDRPSDAWMARCVALAGVDAVNARALSDTIDRVSARSAPSAFARVVDEGEIIALGLAAIEDGFVFFGDISTSVERRRQGYARAIVMALMQWGRDKGASKALLQVVADNASARSLYASLGFEERYVYRYKARNAGA